MMQTIYTYITKQILATLGISIAVFTFILILGNVLKEIVALLVSGQASLFMMFKALGLLLPYVLVFALPVGLLTAVLLFFGRLSADQELTALKASGVSLISISIPVLIISMICSAFCACINLWFGPVCRANYKDIIRGIDLSTTANFITEESFITQIPGHWLYIGKRDGNQLEEVRIFTLKKGEVDGEYNAKKGRLDIDEEGRFVKIILYNTIAMLRVEKAEKGDIERHYTWQWIELPGEWTSSKIHIEKGDHHSKKPKLTNMTFIQLMEEKRLRESIIERSRFAKKDSYEDSYEESKKDSNEESELYEKIEPLEMLLPVEVQLNRQLAFSFACFSFTLVGIPLGVQSHRRETSIGVAIALILLALYYTFFIVAKSLDTMPQYHPQLIIWLPNFLFQCIGSYLLWKADRGI